MVAETHTIKCRHCSHISSEVQRWHDPSSNAHCRKYECLNCKKIMTTLKGKEITLYGYNPNNEIIFQNQILGKYHLELFYSENIFKRYSLNGRHPSLMEDDILQSITSHHESFHSLQDLATGFGNLVNELMRIRDEYAIEDIQHIIKKGQTLFPLAYQAHSLKNDYLSKKANEAVNQYTKMNAILDYILFGEMEKYGIGSIELFEGSAVFFSEIYRRWHIFLENINAPEEFENIYDFQTILKMVNKLPSQYNLALNYYNEHIAKHWYRASVKSSLK